jgi:hypothetical protein
VTDFPDLKIKALVSFPAAVSGGTGLAVRQVNGRYYFDLAFDELAQITTIPAPVLPTTFLPLWESTQNTYRRMSVPDLQTQIGGGIPDAPNDGTQYGRQSLGWTPIVGGLSGAVRYDIAQSLTTAQKKQAGTNIFIAPVVTTYTTGSGTHNVTAGCTYLRITLVGGGAGGQGGGTSTSGGSGGNGGNTSFGTVIGNGGVAAAAPNNPVAGGTASLGSAVGLAVQGGSGSGGGQAASAGGYYSGAPGGNSILGGGGGASGAASAGGAAAPNSGGGGGGGNSSAGAASVNFGVGGSAGGGVIAIINSPAASYSYAVGAAGTAGAAGAGGTAGGAGAAGIIVIEEHFGS